MAARSPAGEEGDGGGELESFGQIQCVDFPETPKFPVILFSQHVPLFIAS